MADAPDVLDAPRPTDVNIFSSLSLADLQTCFTRVMARKGAVTPIPLPDGAALDFSMKTGAFTPPGKALLTIEIHDEGAKRRMTAGYRRPWSKKVAVGLLNSAAKKCVLEGEFNSPPPLRN